MKKQNISNIVSIIRIVIKNTKLSSHAFLDKRNNFMKTYTSSNQNEQLRNRDDKNQKFKRKFDQMIQKLAVTSQFNEILERFQ